MDTCYTSPVVLHSPNACAQLYHPGRYQATMDSFSALSALLLTCFPRKKLGLLFAQSMTPSLDKRLNSKVSHEEVCPEEDVRRNNSSKCYVISWPGWRTRSSCPYLSSYFPMSLQCRPTLHSKIATKPVASPRNSLSKGDLASYQENTLWLLQVAMSPP